jgi:hypothetical protein
MRRQRAVAAAVFLRGNGGDATSNQLWKAFVDEYWPISVSAAGPAPHFPVAAG